MKKPRGTQLVGGLWDGHIDEDFSCIEGDVVVVNEAVRYVGTGRVTDSGHWEALHDDMDPRVGLNREAAATV